jgi:ferredoxin
LDENKAVLPEHAELAKVFSSVWLFGPPVSEQLMELVSHLFSPREAGLAVHLPYYIPRSLNRIARRAKMPPGEAAVLLDAMASRRVIYRSQRGYALLPLIPGMFEYLLMDGRDTPWHRRYARLINALYATGYTSGYGTRSSPVIRNIPLQSAVEQKSRVVDADLMSRMIASHEHMGVLNVCQCRQSQLFSGEPCKRASAEDGCLVFGSFALSVAEAGSGRMVSREEMRAIVRERWKKNLVFMAANLGPSNSNAVCTCCDCCCHYVESINHYGGRVSLARPHFLARVENDLCTDCGLCVRVCNTNAHGLQGPSHVFYPEKCIGCGLCVEACRQRAITMEENPLHDPPSKSWVSFCMRILPAGVLSALKVMIGRARS